jgi:hypothetical protein
MNRNKRSESEGSLPDLLKAKLSRGQMLTAAGAGIALAAVPGRAVEAATSGQLQFPFYPATSTPYQSEQIQDILNTLVTLEYAGVTGAAGVAANPSALGLSGLALSMVQASVAQDQYHIDFLTSIGANPTTTTFTFPSFASLGSGATQFFMTAVETITNIEIAAYMTAVREFAELGQPSLAKWAYQTGGPHAEERAVFRMLGALAGTSADVPPHNKAFETDLLLYVRDAIPLLMQIGLIGSTNPSYSAVTYPGRAAILAAAGPMAAAVIQKTPNNAASSVSLTPTGGTAVITGERTS